MKIDSTEKRQTDLQVDKVLRDQGVSLRDAGLVEGPGLLLSPGAVVWRRGAEDRADDVLVPLVYRLVRIA